MAMAMRMEVDLPQNWLRGTQEEEENAKKENAILSLERFAAIPWVRFGHVGVGTYSSATITFVNNSEEDKIVVVDRIKDTLTIDQKEFLVPPLSSSNVKATVSWRPEKAGGYRDSIQFRVNNHRFKVVVFGFGVERKKIKVCLFFFFFKFRKMSFITFFLLFSFISSKHVYRNQTRLEEPVWPN